MPTIIFTVDDNSSPNLVITLQRDNTAINLTGATVKLYIHNERTGEQTNTGHEDCTLTTAASGIVTYPVVAGDFPSAGRYLGDAKITYSGGGVERVNERVTIVAREHF